ncbi:hypothetical protein ACFSSC_11735 [Corynebacterium mendelii]|uniref:Uncharacterized protein n=1 Tax=Corynebacterium mendelii TaxID=2765362 RepID=A0A939E241_9CORY|nr:hypothetical protein [Corynebacterium mendelii]MBN9645328.1 hypothetical protein [Corynebacterium mendelii]
MPLPGRQVSVFPVFFRKPARIRSFVPWADMPQAHGPGGFFAVPAFSPTPPGVARHRACRVTLFSHGFIGFLKLPVEFFLRKIIGGRKTTVFESLFSKEPPRFIH